MGITISCKKTGKYIDMGCFGFNRLRNKVAELIGNPFSDHYLELDKTEVAMLSGEEKDKYFRDYDALTEHMIKERKVNIKVADFLYQSDAEGKIRYGACKELLKVIGDYDDDVLYGYCGRKDCAKFCDFVSILKDCVENKCDMIWR